MNGFDEQIRFCISPANVKIAYAQMGEGLPLLKTGNWLTRLESDDDNFIWRHLTETFSENFKFVRYDERGCGLSEREVGDFSLPAEVRDIESVAADLKLEKFALLGISNGTASAIAYAAQNPEKVSHLILIGGAVNENFAGHKPEKLQNFLQILSSHRSIENEVFQREIAAKIFPDSTSEQVSEFIKIQKNSSSPNNIIQILKSFFETDLSDFAKQVKCPTLIFHSMDDEFIPFSQSGLLSTLIPDSKLILLASRNHFPLENEPARHEFLSETKSFLKQYFTE